MSKAREYAEGETVVDLEGMRDAAAARADAVKGRAMIFTDDKYDEPIWELEDRVRFAPEDPVTDYDIDDALVANIAGGGARPQTTGLPAEIADALELASAYDDLDEVSAEQLFAAIADPDTKGGVHVLDVRDLGAPDAVPDAVRVPFENLSEEVRAGNLDHIKDGHVFVLCETGKVAAQAAVRLTKVFMWNNVTNVVGGAKAYERVQSQSG